MRARALVVAALCLLPHVLTPSASAAEADPLLADAGKIAERYGLPIGEVEDRLRLQDEVGELAAEAAVLWPETFAGLWSDGVVSVAFTEGAEANVAQLAAGFADPGRLRAVTAGHSRAELVALQNRLVLDREEARAGRLSFPGVEGARYDLDIDVRRNTVVVLVEDARPDTVAAFTSRYGGPLVVEQASLGESEACTRTDCRSSLRSGLRSTMPNGGSCTTAFKTTGGYLFSAGHCAVASPGARRHAGSQYGSVVSHQMLGRVDAELQTAWSNGFYAGAWIWVSSSEQVRKVTSTGTYSTIAVGNFFCKSGITTEETCGSVTSVDYAPSTIALSNRFIRGDYCGEPGDSGAGVYIGGKALGIHSGGETGDCNFTDDWSYFGHIEYAQSTLGVLVATSESAPSFSSISGVQHNVATFNATFSKPIRCSSVNTYDFVVKTNNAYTHTVTATGGCSNDTDSTITITVNPAPVALTSFSVQLVGLIQDAFGTSAASSTKTVTSVPL